MGDWYPVTGFYFSVRFVGGLATLASLTDSSFKEVSGLEMKVDTETITEGGVNNYLWKVPKPTEYSNLVLKRGVSPQVSLISTWVKSTMGSVLSSTISPITVIVLLMNEKSIPLSGWACMNAFPVKWKISEFDSMKNEVVIEELEFSYTHFIEIPVAALGNSITSAISAVSLRYSNNPTFYAC